MPRVNHIILLLIYLFFTVFSDFSTFKAKLLPKSKISKIELVAELLGALREMPNSPAPDNFSFRIDPFGPRVGGCQIELNSP